MKNVVFEMRPKLIVLVAAVVISTAIGNVAVAVSYVTEQITFDEYNHYSTSINNDGEIVWEVLLNTSPGETVIVSNVRGVIYQGEWWHRPQHPFISNDGQIVYDRKAGAYHYRQIFRFGTQITTDNYHHRDPAINIHGEIIWWESDGTGQEQIVSNIRGQITSGEDTSHLDPAINDLGEILWVETSGLYKIVSNIRGTIAQGSVFRYPAINNHGEVVWSGAAQDGRKIFSTFDGMLDLGEGYQDDPSINDFGVVSYTQKVGDYWQVFRATPIPEASTLSLFGLAFVVGMGLVKRPFWKKSKTI